MLMAYRLDNWQEELEGIKRATADLRRLYRQNERMNLPNCVFIDNTASPKPIEFYEEVFKSNHIGSYL
jgi:aspartokinase/homoserine dehydrogenase 1